MKKLLASTALLMAFAGAASAQSVLERVLAQVDNSTNLASVNGTFANIAENIGGQGSVTTFTADLTDAQAAALGLPALTAAASDTYTLSQSQLDSLVTADEYIEVPANGAINNTTGAVISNAAYLALSAAEKNAYTLNGAAIGYYNPTNIAGEPALSAAAYANVVSAAAFAAETVYSGLGIEGINGSINNVINGLDTATMVAAVGAVTATEFLLPTIDLGNISSTVLGAVNTGEITLGVNQAVDQAKTTSTGALSSVIEQIGGSADTGALVLNIASNMTGVNGSINNTMTGVNGSVGTAATTVLGAVNTGTITSGINAAVAGIVGGTSQSGL